MKVLKLKGDSIREVTPCLLDCFIHIHTKARKLRRKEEAEGEGERSEAQCKQVRYVTNHLPENTK